MQRETRRKTPPIRSIRLALGLEISMPRSASRPKSCRPACLSPPALSRAAWPENRTNLFATQNSWGTIKTGRAESLPPRHGCPEFGGSHGWVALAENAGRSKLLQGKAQPEASRPTPLRGLSPPPRNCEAWAQQKFQERATMSLALSGPRR